MACAALALLASVAAAPASVALAGTPAPSVRIAASEDETTYIVVVNSSGQYSIWPDGRERPRGWESAGFSGSKQECLDYIRSHR